jgi:hypothetical protein
MTGKEHRRPIVPTPWGRPCEDCDAYRAHIGHEGLVYRFIYSLREDGKRRYHRHIAFCPDYAAGDPKNIH